ncbi:MAG: tetratricopeptide repeat protein [Planctomycetes bacterium]|nr:tetratricopeptide repeat protein [Planctomycetota bacterium]
MTSSSLQDPQRRRRLPAVAALLALGLSGCAATPTSGPESPEERLQHLLETSPTSTQELSKAVRALSLESPDAIPVLVADAALSLETGRTERAASLVQRVLAAQPDHVDALLIATRISARTGDLAGAHRRIDAALRLRPDRPELHEAQAAVLFVEERLSEASAALDRADALRGGPSWRNEYHRGLIAEGQDDLTAAARHYSRCLDLEASFEPAMNRRRWVAAQLETRTP